MTPAAAMMTSPAVKMYEQSMIADNAELAESTTHNSARLEPSETETKIEIATNENRKVCYLRMALFTVLLIVAALVSGFVYSYTRADEKEDFEVAFLDQGLKVVEQFQSNAVRRLEAVENFAITITSNALSQHLTWPNVTVDHWEKRATYALDLAELVSLIFLPFVTKETRAGWEAYTTENKEWFEEGLNLQGDIARYEHGELESRIIMESTWTRPPGGLDFWPHINMLNGTALVYDTSDIPAGYAPWWQFAPVFITPGLVNYNTLSHPTRKPNIEALMETRRPLATEAWDYSDTSNAKTVGKKAALNMFMNRRKNVGKYYQDGPVSDLYFPIFEQVPGNEEVVPESNKLVGALTAYVYWQVYFDNILSPGSDPVIAILENSCGQKFTYTLKGDTAFYVGGGDLHNTKYDKLEVTTGWHAFLGGTETSDDLQDGQCTYRVRVYPTEDMEDTFTTSTPMYFTVILVSTFLFTSLVFMFYDHMVEKRQRIVMRTAEQTTQVVNTLFPAAVRDRLMNEAINGKNSNKPNHNTNNNAKGGDPAQNQFTVDGKNTSSTDEEDDDADGCIADSYEHCTVMFADLAGFTQWSDARAPKDVFNLLETLYGAFDKIAKRRCVFKVETIGDCYLCATGLPRPQDKHALIMARFAGECVQEMDKVIGQKLVKRHGKETAKLKLRVGLHSGTVTAGVLRGDRARFQLFGDTVNTASRMESNGVPGKIQASASTAQLLTQAGKQSWVHQRQGGIEAKGKGRLETFWIEPLLVGGSRSSCSGSSFADDSDNEDDHSGEHD